MALYCLTVVVNVAAKCYSVYLRKGLEHDGQQHINFSATGQLGSLNIGVCFFSLEPIPSALVVYNAQVAWFHLEQKFSSYF
jgi:hypothetical protein